MTKLSKAYEIIHVPTGILWRGIVLNPGIKYCRGELWAEFLRCLVNKETFTICVGIFDNRTYKTFSVNALHDLKQMDFKVEYCIENVSITEFELMELEL